MRFEQITAAVIRNFAVVEVRANLVVTSVLAAASHFMDRLGKLLGTPTSRGFHDHTHDSHIERITLAIHGGVPSSDGPSWLCSKRIPMFGCPAMVCASYPVRDRRPGVNG